MERETYRGERLWKMEKVEGKTLRSRARALPVGGIRDKAQDKIERGMRIGKLCLLYQGHCWQNMHTVAKEVTY